MIRRILILTLPVVLVVAMEALFRMGAWEPLAEPRSHAGLSVRLKEYLLSPELEHIDFVTIGSSRPQHGIDHEQMAEMLAGHGYKYANLSVPGVHWMSVGVLTNWLEEHHPEIQGGIIALSIQDFSSAGNGSYELEIIEPFRTSGDRDWVEAHVPFDLEQPETWGSRFSLMAWRDDLKNFVMHPFKRINRARKVSRNPKYDELFGNQTLDGSLCNAALNGSEVCDDLAGLRGTDADLFRQCIQIQDELAGLEDFERTLNLPTQPASIEHVRELIQSQLRAIEWRAPPIVVLMPVTPIWLNDSRGKALHQWALRILQPLQEDGTIRIIDATSFFDSDSQEGCAAFSDFYHQTTRSRDEFSEWLIPKIAKSIYSTSLIK